MKFTDKVIAKNRNKTGAPPATIAFLGDSVTQGCFQVYQNGESSVETEYQYQNSYAELLHRRIALTFPMAQVNIINAGISGDSAPGGAARLRRDVLPFSPDLCVVCYGLNDSGHEMQGIAAYANAMRSIFHQLTEAGVEAILLTPNMCCTYPSYEVPEGFLRNIAAAAAKRQNEGILDAYVDTARSIANEMHVPICDVYAKWKRLASCGADITRLLANRINHPTPEMNELFAGSLFEQLFFG